MPEAQQRKLFAELWISFTALVRSYVAANDLAKPVSGHALVDEGDDGFLTLRGERKTLVLEFDASTGTGQWAAYEDDPGLERMLGRGKFRFDEDSQVWLSDEAAAVELGVAAEKFTARVFDEG